MHLVEVAFKGNRKEFFHWPHDESPPLKAAVIVDADRGEDLGVVHATGELAQKRFDGAAHGRLLAPVTKQARRLATPEEVARARELREMHDEDARRRAMERVKAHGLIMKLSDAEWQWDRKKLTFYFTAEKRVDFRALVRDLASAFRARIELKQIGVRDEARRLDGVGRCGRQYCSASWLPELRPVNLAVAKDQKLSLNPLQISGACGRLMCCLRYEHEFYVQSRKRFPKEGRILVTAVGEEKVMANDIFGDRVTLRNVEGDTRVLPLAELKREMATVADGGAAPGVNDGTGDTLAGLGELDAVPPADDEAPVRRSRALPVRDRLPGTPRTTRPATRMDRPDRTARAGESRLAPPRHAAHDGSVQSFATDDDLDAPGNGTAHREGTHAIDHTADQADAHTVDEPTVDHADDGAEPAASDATAAGGEERRRRRRGRRGGRRARGADRPAPDQQDQGE